MRLVRIAWLNAALHAVGLAVALVGMRPGTGLVPEAQRLAYLGAAPLGWTLGWGVWILCAGALVAFVAACGRAIDTAMARFAATVAVAGAAIDVLCDGIQIGVLPMLARGGDLALFRAFDRTANVGGAVAANGFYTVAAALLSVELAARGQRRAAWLGAAVVVCGAAMVAAGFSGVPLHLEWATGPTIGIYCAWALVTARSLEGRWT